MHNPMITFSVPSQKHRTSDTFAVFLSEVPLRNTGPPTLLPHFRRRSPSETQDLRHFFSKSVGGPHKSVKSQATGESEQVYSTQSETYRLIASSNTFIASDLVFSATSIYGLIVL